VFYGATFLLSMALLAFCLVDCIATSSSQVRILPKTMWMLVILLPVVGPAAWLLLGRPERAPLHSGDTRTPATPQARPKRPLGPDDDPRFLEMTRHLSAGRSVPPKREEPAKRLEPPASSPEAGRPAAEHGVNGLKAWEEDLRRREEELRRRLQGESPAGE
jgi:hypothetical protein